MMQRINGYGLLTKLLAVALLGVTSVVSVAQTLEVKKIELRDDDVVINYSLSDTVPGRSFSVNLYASRDNYINPLTQITGDHGLEVSAGNDKTVRWHAKKELGDNFNGAVSVEVRARVYVPFIQVDKIGTTKRGKQKEVTWRGGTRQNILNFELLNAKGERVHVVPNISNSGHTSLFIPPDVKPGKNYKFRVVDSKNKDQVVRTEPFAIKRKMPMVLYVIPVAVLGGVVSLLSSSGGDSPGEIPGPPNPPD